MLTLSDIKHKICHFSSYANYRPFWYATVWVLTYATFLFIDLIFLLFIYLFSSDSSVLEIIENNILSINIKAVLVSPLAFVIIDAALGRKYKPIGLFELCYNFIMPIILIVFTYNISPYIADTHNCRLEINCFIIVATFINIFLSKIKYYTDLMKQKSQLLYPGEITRRVL